MRTFANRTPRRSARVRLVNDQSPPVTVMVENVHRSKVEPTTLQPSNVASKYEQRTKVQFVKAVAVTIAALKRTLRNVHRSKTHMPIREPVMSTSSNRVNWND